jgi:F0F1-type ATP synthase assembly protein I
LLPSALVQRRRFHRGQEFVVEPAVPKKKIPIKTSDKQAWMLVSSGLQIVGIVGLFFFLGHWLDARYSTAPWFTLGGSVVGIGLGLYGLLVPFLKK